jgi:hypothetical protein
MSAKKMAFKHDHRRSMWLIAGGHIAWCYQCGAWRGLWVRGLPWHHPSGKDGENPALAELRKEK